MSNKSAPSAPTRSLVGRMTRTYLLGAVIAYVVALAGLWYSAHFVVELSLTDQAARLAPEFDELGTPLFLSQEGPPLARMRKHAANNSDILYARYYRAEDLKPVGEYLKRAKVSIPALDSAQIRQLNAPSSPNSARYTLTYATHMLGIITSLRMLAPIRTHSMKDDMLFDFGLDNKGGEHISTIGYLDIGMDIAPSRAIVINSLLVVAGILTLVLVAALLLARRHVRKSLAPLLQLQGPLEQLAAGNFNVVVEQRARDREIAVVCDAVNKSIEGLRQRDAEKEEALHAKLAAEAANQAKSQFLAHMSHEVRTPLNGILGFLKLLSNTTLNGTQHEYLRTTEISARTLMTVINDILDFSKIEAGKVSIEEIDIELRELIEEVVSLHAANAEHKGLDLVLVFRRDIPTQLRGDPSRISQVISNLLGNAIKFTEHGEVLIHVSLQEDNNDDVIVQVSVKDSGIGIAPEAIERLFQPFSQADASTTRKYGGTGLGLIISRRLVELMGGTIQVESQAGHGATFQFALRLPKQQEAWICMPLADIMAKLRILSVTPNPGVSRSLAENLGAWGVASDTVGSGKAALLALADARPRHQPYSAVIFDNATKDMTPGEFTHHIRANDRLADIKLMLLGGLSTCLRTEEVRAEGFVSCVSKPAKSSELYNELSRLFVCSQKIPTELEEREAPLISPGSGGNLQVLIVDDNDINRKLVQILVNQLGCDADLAEDGVQAVEAFTKHTYDIILMDVHMPNMDGVEATKRIRDLEDAGKHTTIVAVTANALSGDRESYLAAGMDDYLSKPIVPRSLTGMLRKWCSIGSAAAQTAANPSPIAESVAGGDGAGLSILDPVLGIELALGDRATWQTVLGMLFEQLPEFAEHITAALENHDSESLRQASHKLAGTSSYCGTPCMQHHAKQTELLIKAGKIDEAEQMGKALLSEIARLQALKTEGRLPLEDRAVY